MSEGRKYKTWEPLILSLMTVLGMLAGIKFANTGHNANDHTHLSLTQERYNGQEVEEILRFVESKYVGEVETKELVDDAIVAILENLDPHTHYIPPDEVESLHERTSGNYVGIGIEVAFIEDSLMVLYPKPDSPAEKAGIRPGDFIIAVDGRSISLDSLDKKEVLNRIKGEKGSRVQLTIKPLLNSETHEAEVIRDQIKVPSVVAAYMMDTSTAYIRIQRFTNTTYREFMDHWERMASKKQAKHLILDLRDNPGGYLSEAVNILSQIFKQEGQLLLYTEGANQKRNEYKSTGKVFFEIENVAVLINEGSASASEIIAGCLQDHDRGFVIGSPTFGKGLVQEQYELSNGGILRMTVSRYYTPSGRSIQKPYDTTYITDTNAVFKTTHGRLVYPDGGITPDIVITDSVQWSHPLMRDWMDIISLYAIRESILENGGSLAPAEKFEEVLKAIPADTVIIASLQSMIAHKDKEEGKALEAFLLKNNQDLVRIARATLIAYRIGEEGWYRGFNETDPVVLKAEETLGAKMKEVLEL